MPWHDKARTEEPRAVPGVERSFHEQFVALFDAHYERLYRYMNRLAGEPDLAADVVQDAFVKLYRRGSLPKSPEAWLVTVAMNLFRNERSTRDRRRRLLTLPRAGVLRPEAPPSPDEGLTVEDTRRRVRGALGRLPERERHLLLLQAEGFRYRDIATALGLNEASVGTLLARARRAFREAYEERVDAP